MGWNHKTYGTAVDPIRQSDLNDVASPHGCSVRFRNRKTEQADGVKLERTCARWATVNGSAIHETIRRALAPGPWAKLQSNARAIDSEAFRDRLGAVYDEELERDAAGLPIEWDGENPANVRWKAIVMLREVLRDLLVRIERPLAIEAPFRSEINGYHTEGTVDLLYEPKGRPGAVGLVDWKSGSQRIAPIILAHGYQGALYAHAVEHGVFWPGTPDERRFGVFPSEIHFVHLRDLLPYEKRTAFTLERPEEIEWCSELAGRQLARGAVVEIEPLDAPPPRTKKNGQPYKERARKRRIDARFKSGRRGPAWYAAPRTPEDVARLRVSIASIVGTVRLGRFYESIGEPCERCPFRLPCLNQGYVDRDAVRLIDRTLAGVDVPEELLIRQAC